MPTWRSVEQQICPPFKKIAGKWREVFNTLQLLKTTAQFKVLRFVFKLLKSTLS